MLPSDTEGATFEDGDSEGQEGCTVDLSGVDEAADFEVLPRGMYNCVISELTFEYSQRSGKPMWSTRLEIEDGDYASRILFTHISFSEKALPMTKRTLSRIAPELLEEAFDAEAVADEGNLIGRRCRARVDIRPYEGRKRNNVRELLEPIGEGDDFSG